MPSLAVPDHASQRTPSWSFITGPGVPEPWLSFPEPPRRVILADRIADLDPLLSNDVTPLWDADGLYTARVCFGDDGLFDFADEARDPSSAVVAIIIECRDEYGDIVDLAAWRPGEGRIALWRGRVFALGQDELLAPRGDEPLMVYATVGAWLRGGRDGVVIIDFQRAALALHGHSIRTGRDIAFAQRLREILTIAPEIFVGDDEC